jgi:hypothetical protein
MRKFRPKKGTEDDLTAKNQSSFGRVRSVFGRTMSYFIHGAVWEATAPYELLRIAAFESKGYLNSLFIP